MIKVLFDEETIQRRIAELAAAIHEKYGEQEILLVGILKGSFVFMADLLKALPGNVQIDFMALSSYGDSTESSGVVRLIKDLDVAIEGKNVIIVEDIVDTGLTLDYLVHSLMQRHPASIELCALLDKKCRREVEIDLDYTGFEIDDGFIVGYGIDWAQRHRNLPYIGVVEKE